MKSDVVIIGAGVMGCAVAWRLRRRGLQVMLVERGIPGAEASSAAAGILAPQAESEGPGPFLDLALRSRALYPAWIAELADETGLDVGYRTEGTLSLAGAGGVPDPGEEMDALMERLSWQKRAGLRVSLLSSDDVRQAEPQLGPCAAALHFPDDHQLEAPLLARALQVAAAQAGARFVTGHVQRVLQEENRATGVLVEGEQLHADHVVVAAGSWSGLIEGAALPRRAVRPMRGQMLELDVRPPALRHVVFGHVPGPAGRPDDPGGLVGGYLVPRRDGRIVAGSTMELVGFRKEVTVSGLLRLLHLVQGLAPALSEAELRRTWAGFRPYTEDELPILGAGPLSGLHLCTGHHRNGILLTPISAEVICHSVTGRFSPGVAPVDLRPFSLSRLPLG